MKYFKEFLIQEVKGTDHVIALLNDSELFSLGQK